MIDARRRKHRAEKQVDVFRTLHHFQRVEIGEGFGGFVGRPFSEQIRVECGIVSEKVGAALRMNGADAARSRCGVDQEKEQEHTKMV